MPDTLPWRKEDECNRLAAHPGTDVARTLGKEEPRGSRKAEAAHILMGAIFVDVTAEPKGVSSPRERLGRQVKRLNPKPRGTLY